MGEKFKRKMDRAVEWCIYSYGTVRFRKEINRCKNGECPFCGKRINHDDFTSRQEKEIFNRTGLCLNCQKEVLTW